MLVGLHHLPREELHHCPGPFAGLNWERDRRLKARSPGRDCSGSFISSLRSATVQIPAALEGRTYYRPAPLLAACAHRVFDTAIAYRAVNLSRLAKKINPCRRPGERNQTGSDKAITAGHKRFGRERYRNRSRPLPYLGEPVPE